MLARPAVKTTVAPLPSTAPGLPAPAAGPPPPHGLRQHVLGLVMLVAMLALSALAIAPYIPRAVAPANSSAATFSAARALPHLQAIAQHPRPVGSPADLATRDYLVEQVVALGLPPEVQRGEVLSPRGGQAAVIYNVLARIDGTGSTRALLVTAHYDSLETTPGVGDNAMSIAAMLETIRALRASPPLLNDVIFLFNDGEEYAGLAGSTAFVREHPLAGEVGVVFDFDGDSPKGASTLEWTTAGDAWIVGEIARSDSSLLAAPEDVVGKRAEHNNDLHVFAAAGFNGAHIGRLGGSTSYHNQRDSLANLDSAALQQQGDAMLALVRHFGNLPLDSGTTSSSDSAAFTVFGSRIVSYPFGWTLPLAGLSLVLATAAAGLGWRRGRVRMRSLAAGLAALVGLALGGALVAHLGWQIVLAAHPESGSFPDQDFYAQVWYVLAVYALSVATGLAIWPPLARRLGEGSLAAAGLLGMAGAGLGLAVLLPFVAYLAIWPALAGAVGLVWLFALPTHQAWLRLAPMLLVVASATGFLVAGLYVPIVNGVEGSPALQVVMLVLVFGLLTPQMIPLASLAHRWLPAGVAALGVGLLVVGTVSSGFDAAQPRPDNLLYSLNAETGQAYWATPDRQLDDWTRQYLAGGTPRALDDVLGGGGAMTLLSNPAPAVQLPGPVLTVRGQQREGEVRTLQLHMSSSRQAWRAYLIPGPRTELLGAALDDATPVPMSSGTLDVVGLPNEGLDVTVRVQAAGAATLVLIDQTIGLPDIPGAPARPASVMPAIAPDNMRGYPTYVSATFTYP